MKKVISLFLAMMLVCAFLPSNILAWDESSFVDVYGFEDYAYAAEVLLQCGIISGYEDGSFGAEKSITRAEMAAIICRFIGEEDTALRLKGTTTPLSQDVSARHWASGYVALAIERGIINGDGNGYFRPEDNVSYEEAVKMVVCAAGLDNFVKTNPYDWAAGYIDVAQIYGLMDFVSCERGERANRGDVALMIYNAMFCESEDYEENENSVVNDDFEIEDESELRNMEDEVIRLVNEERKKAGLHELYKDDDLADVARAHSEDMCIRNFFNHTNPDGESPFDRMSNYGITYRAAAENIAMGQTSSQEVMNSWMNSPGHKANILSEDLRYIGVGLCRVNGVCYWTQCFKG